MNSVGIDVSKGRSTVAVMRPFALSAWRALSLFWRVSSFHSLPLLRPLSILTLRR